MDMHETNGSCTDTEQQIERLVDSLGISYADARERLGLDAPPVETAASRQKAELAAFRAQHLADVAARAIANGADPVLLAARQRVRDERRLRRY